MHYEHWHHIQFSVLLFIFAIFIQKVFVEWMINNSGWHLLIIYYVPGSVLSDLYSLWQGQTSLTTTLRRELLSKKRDWASRVISPPQPPATQL